MSDEMKRITTLSKKTISDSITKQVRYPKSLLFSLVLIILFSVSVFVVKPDLVITFEDVEGEEIEGEEDFAEKFGPITIALFVGFVLPFIIWTYFRELIQYFLLKFLSRGKDAIDDQEQQKILSKKSRNMYFLIRRILINIHTVGGISACILIVLHMIGLFPLHDGMSFFFSWIAMLSGIYLASAGILLRFRFKSHLPLTKRTSKIGRAIHLQLIITSIGALSIILHLSFS
ncbi:MAG: hypothetical protein ACXAC6_02425 [Candidatus Hodarchaeales archaeon]|jgi:hypothetical protein